MTKRGLVCEDDGAIRFLLDKLLTRHGLSAECVTNGAAAAARLRHETYDLILLDLAMPVMSGYELVDLLQRERPYLLDRVIIISALQRAFAEALPVAAFLRKPFDLADLDRTIERVLARSIRDLNRGQAYAKGELR